MNIQPVTKRTSLDPLSCSYRESNLQNVRRAMRRFVEVAALCFGLLSAEPSFCQATTAVPQGGAGHADQASCVVLKRTGTVDRVTRRVLSFGMRGTQFEYIEGRLPEGFPFHGKLTEHDVRNLEARGSEVIVLNSDFLPEELREAREACRAEMRKTPTQASTQIEIDSNPLGTDIELDGNYIGSTPSTVKVSSGEHTVRLTKNGYDPWERRITTPAGGLTISPELEPVTPTPNRFVENRNFDGQVAPPIQKGDDEEHFDPNQVVPTLLRVD